MSIWTSSPGANWGPSVRGTCSAFDVLPHGAMFYKKGNFMAVITAHHYVNSSRVPSDLLRENSTNAYISY
jgi:hypothetical protein